MVVHLRDGLKYAVIGTDKLGELKKEGISLTYFKYTQVSTKVLIEFDRVIINILDKEDFPKKHLIRLATYLAHNDVPVDIIDEEESLDIDTDNIRLYQSVTSYLASYKLSENPKKESPKEIIREVQLEKFMKYAIYGLLDILDTRSFRTTNNEIVIRLEKNSVEEMSQIFGFTIEEMDDENVLLKFKLRKKDATESKVTYTDS